MYTLPILLVHLLLLCFIDSAKILTVLLIPAYSHFITMDLLSRDLANRGHNVTFISTIGNHKENEYEHILLDDISECFNSVVNFYDNETYSAIPDFRLSRKIFNAFLEPIDAMLGHEKFANVLHNRRFDLIIIDYSQNPALFGLGHHFKAPMIALLTYGYDTISYEMMTSPNPSSFVPDVTANHGSKMTFLQRLINFLQINLKKFYFYFFVLDEQNEILRKYLPLQPHLKELFFTTSIMLTNTHPSFRYAQPNQPNIIDVGGMHIRNSTLPKDLQKILDEATEGFIYFSLGSFVAYDKLPEYKLESIFNALKKTNMKVLLKFPDDGNNRCDNFIFGKWFPQQAVLGHPNIKLFITHGGMHSLIEAVHYGVPVVGLPVLYDQDHNMKVSVENGIGLSLNFHELEQEKFYSLLIEVLSNPIYKSAVEERSKAFRDRPLPPMDTAVYWIEYVIKHKGARFFKSPGSELTWYQYNSFDVIGFIILCMWIIGYGIRRSFQGKSTEKRKQD